MPPQRASSIANLRAASKISPALRDTRLTGSNAGIRANVVDECSTNVNNDHELVDKSVGKTKMGMMTPRCAEKPFKAVAVKQVGSSQREAVHRDNSHPAKTVRDMPTPATRSSKTQPPSTVATSRNDPTAVTKRPPPPPPSKIKKPGFVSDRRRVNVTEQKRPASMDCSAVGSVRQQSVGDFGKKSDSCTNVTNLSTSIEQPRKPAKGVLNKNAHLTKSCDSIMPFCIDSEMKNSDTVCSQMNGSSISLVDMPPRKLVKPYSVINRCSNFGRKMTPLKIVHPTTLGYNKETETQNVAASSRSSLASQARASELCDLPEVDEFECDCHKSSLGRLSADEGDRGRDDGRRQSPVERTEAMEFSSMCPSIQQKSTERYKYRAEYSTFLSAFPPKDDKLIAETAHVASNILSSHQNCISVMIKQDKNDMEDRVQLSGHSEPDNKSSISATCRPTTLSAEIPIVKDATAEAADKSSSSDNYVVTYESDNIVVLDREPVIDCLTPDGDVVSAEVCKRLTVPVGTAAGESGLSRTLPLSESGYDTWKSSQGSVTVAVGGTCVAAPDVSAEQRQEHEQDGTLRGCECNRLKAFDMQSAQEKNVETEGWENCRREKGSDLSELIKDGDNLYGESTKTVAGAAAAAEINERYGESANDDSGRVADSSVEDSALGDAQMFSSICSDVVEPVAGGESCSSISQCSRPSPSPADNAVSGLVDPIDICFSSQTMPSDDSDILSTFRSSPLNAAHLERFDEEVDNASLLLLGMGRLRHHVDVEISGVPDNSADSDIRSDSAVISTRKMAGFDAGGDRVTDVKQSDEYRGLLSKVSHFTQSDGNGGSVGPSSAVITAAVSDSTSLDPYETICDDLLESVEANISDSETSLPSSSTCQPAAPCFTDVGRQPDNKTLEQPPEKLTLANDHHTTAVAVSSSGADWQSTQSSISTLNSGCPPATTAMTGRLPAMTLRRVRTNFSVVYRHTTSQSTASQSRQSSAHSGHVEAKADTRQTLSHGVDPQPGAVGCLAVLASRLDDHGRRRLPATNVDKRAISKQTLQSAAVHHDSDVAVDSSAISLSSLVRPIASSSTITSYSGATAASVNLPSTQSPVNVQDVASVKADPKLPTSVITTSHDSVPKKPSTFRKLLSSKLTNVVRRTQTNKTRTSSLS